MSQYTELQPEQAADHENSLAPGVPTNVALDGVDAQGAPTANGDTTTATSVSLTDTANADRLVEIFDGTTSRGVVSVGNDGRWSASNIAITVGTHSFTAQAKFGSEPTSPPRTLTRATPLSIDTSFLNLDGAHIKLVSDTLRGWVRLKDNPEAMAQRSATGGIPPYRYTSSAPDVASVDTEGTVQSQRNGQAIITVTDTEGTSLSYPVVTSNNIDLYASDPTELFTYQEASNWIAGSTLNKRFPHHSDALGAALFTDLKNFRYPSGSASYHTGVLNPGSSDLINFFLITPTYAVYSGSVGLSNRYAVMCYRDRN